MSRILQQLSRLPFFKFITSIQITVWGLIFLCVLTFWGTLYQADHGLYLAKQRFFSSWFFLTGGFIPFPGGRLVMWILFINVLADTILKFSLYSKTRIGILIIHLGLLSFLIGGFVTFHFSKESHLTLGENRGSNVSTDYYDWELALWKYQGNKRLVNALDTKGLRSGERLVFDRFGVTVDIEQHIANARPFAKKAGDKKTIINYAGIGNLKEIKSETGPERKIPGIIFRIGGLTDVSYLLYGGEINPTPVTIHGKKYQLQLRRKRHPLPLTLTLLDFKKVEHPGTSTPKSFESRVLITSEDGMERETLIYMNHPLRFGNYTFFQSSYAVDREGNEKSTLAVVENSGKFIPYLASLLTFGGLLFHFMVMLVKHAGRQSASAKGVPA